jgi:hypothetical protein
MLVILRTISMNIAVLHIKPYLVQMLLQPLLQQQSS